MQSCFKTSGSDGDADDLDQGCEAGLAAAFAPELVFQRDCDYDYSVVPNRLGGEYYYAVQARMYGGIRIAYLPAYYKDCGALGLGCPTVDALCHGHTGDSEFIIADIEYDSLVGHWLTDSVFLSAHCGSAFGSLCKWYPHPFFQWVDGKSRGAPVVWVSEGKHANYWSSGTCDAGAYGWDTCDFDDNRQRFPITYSWQNIGSSGLPLVDCTIARWGSTATGNFATGNFTIECLWSGAPYMFNGWEPLQDGGSTRYGTILRDYGRFGVTAGAGRTVGPVDRTTITPATYIMDAVSWAPFAVQMFDSTGAQVIGPTPTWSSSNPQVAVVDQTGGVTALSAGTAVISAKYRLSTGTSVVTVYTR